MINHELTTDVYDLLAQTTEQDNIHDYGENFVSINEVAGQRVVCKIPRISRLPQLAMFHEAMSLAILQDYSDTAPVLIPKMVNYNGTHKPYYVAIEYIEGQSIDETQFQSLPVQEQYDIGHKIGAFVAWMADAFMLQEYEASLGSPNTPKPAFMGAHRLDLLQQRLSHKNHMDIPWPKGLQHITDVVLEESDILCSEEDLPVIIGHKDLRLPNMVFEASSDKVTVKGIIDFGVTSYSSPEYELRTMVPLGSHALAGSIAGYESVADYKLDDEMIVFYGRLQAINMMLNRLRHGVDASPEHYRVMQTAFPEITLVPLSQQETCST